MTIMSCSLGTNLSRIIFNRTFLVRFGGISGEFGRAMLHIQVVSTMARPKYVR